MLHQSTSPTASDRLSRRHLLRSTAGIAVAGAAAWTSRTTQGAERTNSAAAATKGRIQQSIVHWCFANHWDMDRMCQIAQQLGCKSVELVPYDHWPTLKKYNLICALANSHLFVQGMNNPRYQPLCIEMIKKSIDQCADAGFPTVIKIGRAHV